MMSSPSADPYDSGFWDVPSDRGAYPAGAPSTSEERAPKRKGGKVRTTLYSLMIVLGLVLAGGTAGGMLYVKSINDSIDRVDAFTGVPAADRPPIVERAVGAKNILILGGDTRDPDNPGGSRGDTIILVHLPTGRATAQLISIPRDTLVYVPRSADGQHGDQEAKISTAFDWGGVPLTVRTVEMFTGVRVDHVMLVDFGGFKEIVDALGGVEITVAEAFTVTHPLDPGVERSFAAGKQEMDGTAVLDYARERFAGKDGDFARIRHQHEVIKAILDKAASLGLLTDARRLHTFVRATAGSMAVDETLSVLDLALELRHLRNRDLTFIISPSTGTTRQGTENVVRSDEAKVERFYAAVRNDSVAGILKAAGKD